MKTRAAVLERMGVEQPYRDTRPLLVEDLEIDEPAAGELLVRVEAAGVCHSDLSVINGTRPWPMPLALGHEAAGTVEAVGSGVSDVRTGDHVVLVFLPMCGRCRECSGGRPTMCPRGAAANREGRMLGGGRRLHRRGQEVNHHLGVSAFSQYAVVDRGSAVVLDEDIPLETAALFGCGVLTGVGAVFNTARVRPGESVMVFGLGGVGLSAVLGAVVAGAHPIMAVDPISSKRELAVALGATHAATPEDAAELVAAGTWVKADHTIEAVGHPAVLRAAYDLTARGGNTVTVGIPAPDVEVSLPALSIVGEGRTIMGSYMGSAAPQRDIPRLLSLWRAGRLPVENLHSGTVALDDLNEAMDKLAEGTVVRQIVRL